MEKSDCFTRSRSPSSPLLFSETHEFVSFKCLSVLGFTRLYSDALRDGVLKTLYSQHMGVQRMKSNARQYCSGRGFMLRSSIVRNNVQRALIQKKCFYTHWYTPWPDTRKPWSRLHAYFAKPKKKRDFFFWFQFFLIQNGQGICTCKHYDSSIKGSILQIRITRNFGCWQRTSFLVSWVPNFLSAKWYPTSFSPACHSQSNGLAEHFLDTSSQPCRKWLFS